MVQSVCAAGYSSLLKGQPKKHRRRSIGDLYQAQRPRRVPPDKWQAVFDIFFAELCRSAVSAWIAEKGAA